MSGTTLPSPFAAALKRALIAAGQRQADLARSLGVDPGQVSRWATGKSVPHSATVRKLEDLLDADLSDALEESTPDYELYVSAPITGLGTDAISAHHSLVAPVVEAARGVANGVYWPGEAVLSGDHLRAADIATEDNLRALNECESFLYLQFEEVTQPTGSLIELGLAMGQKRKTTIIYKQGLKLPWMLSGFQGVAERLSFMPNVRMYPVADVDGALAFLRVNGRGVLGLT